MARLVGGSANSRPMSSGRRKRRTPGRFSPSPRVPCREIVCQAPRRERGDPPPRSASASRPASRKSPLQQHSDVRPPARSCSPVDTASDGLVHRPAPETAGPDRRLEPAGPAVPDLANTLEKRGAPASVVAASPCARRPVRLTKPRKHDLLRDLHRLRPRGWSIRFGNTKRTA